MKVEYIELEGFRGTRNKVRVEFSPNVNIVSGRNGAGKSTLLDAVEFVLTGSISKYSIDKSGKDSLADYIWWRGDGSPSDCYAGVGIRSDGGELVQITRSRQSGLWSSHENFQEALFGDQCGVELASRLCSVSILRDEKISALGLEMTETQRYNFVREALGTVGDEELLSKAEAAHELLQEELSRAKLAHQQHNLDVGNALSQLTRERDQLVRTPDYEEATKRLAEIFPNQGADALAAKTQAQAELVRLTQAVDALAAAIATNEELSREAEGMSALLAESNSARQEVDSAAARVKEARDRSDTAKLEYQREFERSDLAGKLIEAVDGANAVGLTDGHCPVCDASRTVGQFEQGIAKARARVKALSAALAIAKNQHDVALAILKAEDSKFTSANNRLLEIEVKVNRFASRKQVNDEAIVRLLATSDDQPDLDKAISLREVLRSQASIVERAILAFAASAGTRRVAQSEERVAAVRAQQSLSAARLSRVERAVDNAKLIAHAIRRTTGELLNERLAAVSPLLDEFYSRLRPHTEWKRIHYSVRGDVQRLLSLRVGSGLSPQFMFSSGQRRAAGLAFLLSVHVANRCGKLRSLLLDDPVQHVDDYRAVNLIELLAAIAQTGRQVICAVEDPGLADLMSRRMNAAAQKIGKRIELAYEAGVGTRVVSTAELNPPKAVVLKETA